MISLGEFLPTGIAEELSEIDRELAERVYVFWNLKHRHVHVAAVWCMREIAKLREKKP